jgi:cell division protein FtsL
MEDFKDFKKVFFWVIGIVIALSVIGFIVHKAREATQIDNAVLRYEEYQEIYNTCQKLNTDLCNMKNMPETDIMFQQFSKAQRILTLQTQLNRWVEEYNAKSLMWGRALWKSNALPYQLSVDQFNCNN